MRAVSRVRPFLLGLALMHLLPATHHGRDLIHAPNPSDAWKAFGATMAVVLLAMPTAWLVKILGPHARAKREFGPNRRPWRTLRFRTVSVVATLLAVAHVVPAADHLPKLFASPNWGDAWRGILSALAVAWFASPRALQLRVVRVCFQSVRGSRAAQPLAGGVR